jgi:hypothetical protein
MSYNLTYLIVATWDEATDTIWLQPGHPGVPCLYLLVGNDTLNIHGSGSLSFVSLLWNGEEWQEITHRYTEARRVKVDSYSIPDDALVAWVNEQMRGLL